MNFLIQCLILIYFSLHVCGSDDYRDILKRVNDTAETSLWPCDRPWPQLELFAPVNVHPNSTRNFEVADFFLKSFFLFWPHKLSKTSVMLVLDEERIGIKNVADLQNRINSDMSNMPFKPAVQFSYNSPSEYYSNSYDRQQLLKFFADNYSTAEFIGISDSDCVITTYVDREDIFENGKPVVNGRTGHFGYHKSNRKESQWPMSTYDFTGYEEPMRCMAYFPMVVKRSHFQLFRDYISQRNNGKDFRAVFRDFVKGGRQYSEVNILCTYMFHFHKDEYVWYVHDTTPAWDGSHDPRPVNGHWSDRSIFSKNMFLPKPRIALHARYHNFSPRGPDIYGKRLHLLILLQRGVCESPPFPKPNARQELYCSQWPKNNTAFTVYEEMHCFEGMEWMNHQNYSTILNMQVDRYNRIVRCDHFFDPKDGLVADMYS